MRGYRLSLTYIYAVHLSLVSDNIMETICFSLFYDGGSTHCFPINLI